MNRLRLAAALVLTLGCACASAPRLRLVDRPDEAGFGTLVVEGLAPRELADVETWPADDARWKELVVVHTGSGPPPADQPAVLGRTQVDGQMLRYSPRFPLVVGLEHTAYFDGALIGAPELMLEFALPRPDRPEPPRVVSIDPGLADVPANLLRVYVNFSTPMHARDVLRHVHVYDDDGKEVVEPFVELPDGLWDPERRRLTLFFDPGRLKRGVGPNQVMGPPLQPDVDYHLVIDAVLEDDHGSRLVEPARWSFRTRADDRASPDPDGWELTPPQGRTGALALAFDEALDRALAERLIRVVDEYGTSVAGRARVLEGGLRWVFEPEGPWGDAMYAVTVSSALEDLAGNAVGHLFDERLAGEARRAPHDVLTRLTFRAR